MTELFQIPTPSMLIPKKAVRASHGTSFSVSARPLLHETLARELSRLVWLGAALSFAIALLTYSPSDPSWSTWTTKTEFQNWMGRVGSTISDLAFQLFGLASFVISFFCAAAAMRKEEQKKNFSKIDAIGVLFLLVSCGALLQLFLPPKMTPWKLPHAGGMLGKFSADGLRYLVGGWGAGLISFLTLMASVILVFRWRVITLSLFAVEKHVPALRQKTVETWKKEAASLRTWFQKQTVKPAVPPISTPGSSPTPPPLPRSMTSLPQKVEANLDDELSRMKASKLPARVVSPEKKVRKPTDGHFELPDLSLLSGRAEIKMKSVDREWYLEKAGILVQKLKDFGVDGEVVNISPGPVITVYEFKPASGVKIKEIANLSDDLTLALSVLSVRIVAPIPGKPVVGIEIPSPHREMVFFKNLIEETPFFSPETRIPVVLGRLASGEPVVADLAAMPHVLVAGATGTGKSVFINTLICSLLYRYTPKQLKLILVDPKMVELSSYENIPHLLLPVVVDSKKAAMALRWTVDEMERRYSLMHRFGVRHMDSYNEKLTELENSREPVEEGHGFLPYIVVVIDEYADLMAVVPKDVEMSISRLAQKARASGIHLVLATQRPSTDVVTGTIKANFPSRISFRVASSVDSKTILDRAGADRLLGNGDMLFHSAGFMSLKRMQGAYISDADISQIVSFLKAQGEPEFDESILAAQDLPEEAFTDGGDLSSHNEEARLYDLAVRVVTEKGEASISLVQRHLRIGYNRAATLIEQMEKEGVISSETGTSKRRTVLARGDY